MLIDLRDDLVHKYSLVTKDLKFSHFEMTGV